MKDPHSKSSMKVRLYLRVSTDEQALHGTSLQSQRETLTKVAETRGWTIAEVYSDDGISGAKSSRPALDRLMREVQPDELVAVTSIDRLARKLKLLLTVIEDMEERDVYFFSVREDWNTSTPMGKFATQMVGAAAELERSLITQRTTEGRRQKALVGKWPSGKPPLGLTIGESGFLELDPSRADGVKLIFDIFISERMGLLQLRGRLHDLDIRTATGKWWWKDSTLHKLLTNPVYAGKHVNGAVAPKIVTAKVFQRVQAQLTSNNRFRPRKAGRSWPLQGRVKCAECGTNWRVNINKGERSYFCPGRESDSTYFERTGIRCTVPRVNAEMLERKMWDEVKNNLSNPRKFLTALEDSIARIEHRLADLETGIGPATRELEVVEESLGRLATDFVRQALNELEYNKLQAEHEARRDAATARIDALGPELKLELEQTHRDLKGAQDWQKTVLHRIDFGLDLKQFTFDPYLGESEELHAYRSIGDHPLASVDDKSVPMALSRVLDSIQATIIAHHGHFEIRGLFDLDVLLEDARRYDPSSPIVPRRLG